MLRYLIYSNVWVAICFSTLTILGFNLRDISIDWCYVGFSFFSILAVYNLQRWVKLSTHNVSSNRDEWLMNRQGQLLVFGILAGVISAALYVFSDYADWRVLLLSSVLTFLYLPPKRFQFLELRRFPFIKLLVVGLVWSILSLPDLLYYQDYMVMFSRAIWVIAITLPFDLRDIYKDQKDGIKNLSSLVGGGKVPYLASLLFLLGFLGENYFVHSYPKIYLPVILSSVLVLINTKIDSKDWYIAGLIESIPAMYFINHFFIS